MENRRSKRKRVEETQSDVNPQQAEQAWQDRLRPIYVLLQQFKQCKETLAYERSFAEDFLIVLGVLFFNSLRQLNISVRAIAPLFDSAFRQHIYLALLALGTDADYQAVATWIEQHHPESPLPQFCDEYEKGMLIPGTLFEVVRDIGYLTGPRRPGKDKSY